MRRTERTEGIGALLVGSALIATFATVTVALFGPFEPAKASEPGKGRYTVAHVEGTWERIDIDTGEICISPLEWTGWICTADEVDEYLEFQNQKEDLRILEGLLRQLELDEMSPLDDPRVERRDI